MSIRAVEADLAGRIRGIERGDRAGSAETAEGPWPFPCTPEYQGRSAVIGGIVMIALGIILLFVRR